MRKIADKSEDIGKVIAEIIDLGEVELPSAACNPHEIAESLALLQRQRTKLTKVQSTVLVQERTWKAEMQALEAEYHIMVDELMETDPDVRAASNSQRQQARARAKAKKERTAYNAAKKEHTAWGAILEACEMSEKNLTIAKESISKLANLVSVNYGGRP